MISFDTALELIQSVAAPIGSETVPLAAAAGRVLAAPLVAMIDSPRTDASSMDGYAVRREDLVHLPARLKVIGESSAGRPFHGMITEGTCARIFTGASVPRGSNHVVIQEHVHRKDDIAVIHKWEMDKPYVRARASDFRTGDELLPKGIQLDARAIVAAAGGDHGSLEVVRRPRLRIVSTGDELVEPGRAREFGDGTPESVSFGVAALAEQFGAHCCDRVRLPDDLHSMQSLAAPVCADADLVVVTGGASVGERDLAKDMFAQLSLQLIFSKLAIKPGKPVWLGRAGERLVLGLPGNPTSALVTARLLMVPLLAVMQGLDIRNVLQWRTAPLVSRLAPCGERETFHRAIMRNGGAEIFAFDNSAAQKTLAQADVLVRQKAGSPPLGAGELVQIIDF